MDGILVLDKPKGKTSRDIVNQVSKILNTKKIGHTGTLDPMATGVLVLCIGKATKLVEVITAYDKEYIAEVTLGLRTDTLDISGNVLEEEDIKIPKEKIKKVLKNMIGSYEQTVPIYSAVKIKGKKLYEYARNHEKIALPSRKVEIKELELLGKIVYKNNKTIFSIRCHVSKGTYIRSLISDIATSLGTIGTMSKLNRTKQGNFTIEEAMSLSNIENHQYKIYSIETILKDYDQIIMDQNLEKKVMNGALISNIYSKDIIVFKKENKVVSIYKKYDKDETFMKPWKMFL